MFHDRSSMSPWATTTSMASCIELKLGGAICRFRPSLCSRTTTSSLMQSSRVTQLDRTRQPGFAQLVAGWRAPVGAVASSAYAGILLEGTKNSDARDSRPRTTTGAAATLGERTP